MKLSLTRMSGNQYAIRNESEGFDKTWRHFTGRNVFEFLRDNGYGDGIGRLSSLVSEDMGLNRSEGISIIG